MRIAVAEMVSDDVENTEANARVISGAVHMYELLHDICDDIWAQKLTRMDIHERASTILRHIETEKFLEEMPCQYE
jgi:hypothetical protein